VGKRLGALSNAWGFLGAGLAIAMAGASACSGPSAIPTEGWTEPLSIWSFHPRSYFGIYDLDFAVSAEDRAFATWSYFNETDGGIFVAVREPGGGWSPAQHLDHSSPAAQTHPGAPEIVGIDPGGGALIVWKERTADGSRAFWSSRHDGRSFSVPGPFATLPREDTGEAAAMGGRGEAIVAWAEGTDMRTVAYAPGQGWAEPVLAARATPGAYVVARSAAMRDSEALTVWTVATADPNLPGNSVGSLLTIRRQDGAWLPAELVAKASRVFDAAVTFDGNGSAIVAWGEQATISSYHVRASVFDGRAWVGVLDVPGSQASLARSSRGDVALIFGNDVFGAGEVTVTRFDGHRFGPAETVRPPGRIQFLGSAPRLALSGGRGDVATWLESDRDGVVELWTAFTSAAGSWSPPERMRLTATPECPPPAKGVLFDLVPIPGVTPSGVASVVWAEGEECGGTFGLAASSRLLPLR
jgi:hypothetical protein